MRRYLLLSSLLGATSLFAYTPQAQAAFEWTPPPQAVEEADPIMAPPPGDNLLTPPAVEQEALPPSPPEADVVAEPKVEMMKPDTEIAEESEMSPMPEAVLAEEEEQEENLTVEVEVPPEEPAAPQEEVMVEETETMPQEDMMVSEDVVEEKAEEQAVAGFGKDLPLITAVRQVIPSDKVYKFGPGIDLGTSVSWEGGRPWEETIQGIAKDLGYSVVLSGNTVNILESMPAPVEVDVVEPTQELAEVVEITEEVATAPVEEVMDTAEKTEEPMMPEATDVEMVEMQAPQEEQEVTEAVETMADPLAAATELNEPSSDNFNQILEANISKLNDSDAVIISSVQDEPYQVDLIAESKGQEDPALEVQENTISSDPLSLEKKPVMADMPSDIEMLPVEDTAIELVEVANDNDVPEMEMDPLSIEEQAPELIQDTAQIVEETYMPEPQAANSATTLAALDEAQKQAQYANALVDVPQPVYIPEPVELVEAPEKMEPPPLVQDDVEEVVIEAEAPLIEEIEEVTPEEVVLSQDIALPSFSDSYKEVRTWKVKKNSDLKETLELWAKEADVELEWQVGETNYKVGYMVWVDGTFEEAVDVLLKGYNKQDGSSPQANFRVDQTKGPTLSINTL